MAANKRVGAGTTAGVRGVSQGATPEKPSEDAEVLRQLMEEDARNRGETLRALKLPNHVEPCVVFKA